jgi:hypothetical protein
VCLHPCSCSKDIDDLAGGLFAQLSMQYGNVSVYTNATAIKTMLTNAFLIATGAWGFGGELTKQNMSFILGGCQRGLSLW